MAGRLSRFLNLERARKPGDAPHHEVVTKERFREEREARLKSGVELEIASPDEQPFLRCPVCEADTNRHAVKCFNCGTRLDTDEARLWNEELWRKRKMEMAQQHRAEAELEKQVEGGDGQRALGEMLARQVAQTERARLGWMEDRELGDTTPLGIRLLRALPSSGWRLAVGGGLLTAFVTAVATAYRNRHTDSVMEGVGLLAAFFLIVLFAPTRTRRRSRCWQDD